MSLKIYPNKWTNYVFSAERVVTELFRQRLKELGYNDTIFPNYISNERREMDMVVLFEKGILIVEVKSLSSLRNLIREVGDERRLIDNLSKKKSEMIGMVRRNNAHLFVSAAFAFPNMNLEDYADVDLSV